MHSPRTDLRRCCGESSDRPSSQSTSFFRDGLDTLDFRTSWSIALATYGSFAPCGVVAAATDPLRTLVDLGATDPAGVDDALMRFVVDGYVTPRAVRACLVRHSQHGRHGVVALRDALDRWSLGDKPVDSDLEALMAEILATFGLPSAEFHAHVGGYEVDFWITDSNVVIECDGWSSHGADHEQFEFDRVRDADLLAKGVITLRVTWRQMVRGPRSVARRIEATLARWSPHVLDPDRPSLTGKDLGADLER